MNPSCFSVRYLSSGHARPILIPIGPSADALNLIKPVIFSYSHTPQNFFQTQDRASSLQDAIRHVETPRPTWTSLALCRSWPPFSLRPRRFLHGAIGFLKGPSTTETLDAEEAETGGECCRDRDKLVPS
jgi:hypothetical protein